MTRKMNALWQKKKKKIVNFNLIRSFCTLETWPLIGSLNNFIYCAQESQEI